MPKNFLRSPVLFFCGTLFFVTPVIAQAPTPPSEFWDYLAEYGDENGNLLDPLEYDQILSMKENDDANSSAASLANKSELVDKTSVRNADMKFEQTSSAQASSAAVKGAAL